MSVPLDLLYVNEKELIVDFQGYGGSSDTSGIYGTIAVIFLFQGFYAFSITPMTSLYPTEISPFKLRTTGIAIFRMLDSSFGYAPLFLILTQRKSCNLYLFFLSSLLASFAMSYAMADLGWKFYFINAAWDFAFLIIAYFTFVETSKLKLEEINARFEGTQVVAGVVDDSSSGIDGRDTKDRGVVEKTRVV